MARPTSSPRSRRVPREVRRRDARQGRRDHVRHGRGADLRAARGPVGPARARAVGRRPAPRRRRRAARGELAAGLRGVLGRDAQRALHHRDQHPPAPGRDRLHRRGLRREGDRLLGGTARRGRRHLARHVRHRAAAGLRWRDPRARRLRGRAGRGVTRAAARPAPRPRHALQLRHHGPAQGRQGAAHRAAGDRGRRRPAGPVRPALRLRRRHRLPVPGPALPRRPAALRRHDPPGRRHRRRHAAVRSRRRAGRDRALPRHAQPVGADDVRADAQAAGGGPHARTTSRRTGWPCTRPRRAPQRSSSR